MAIEMSESPTARTEKQGEAQDVRRLEQVTGSEFGHTAKSILTAEAWRIAHPGGRPRSPEQRLTPHEGVISLYHGITSAEYPRYNLKEGNPLRLEETDLPVTDAEGNTQMQHHSELTIVAIDGGDRDTVNCVFTDAQGARVTSPLDRSVVAGMVLLSERELVEEQLAGPNGDFIKKYLDEIDPSVPKTGDFAMTDELKAATTQAAESSGMITADNMKKTLAALHPDGQYPEAITKFLDETKDELIINPEALARLIKSSVNVETFRTNRQRLITETSAARNALRGLTPETPEYDSQVQAIREKEAQIAQNTNAMNALTPNAEGNIPLEVALNAMQYGNVDTRRSAETVNQMMQGNFTPLLEMSTDVVKQLNAEHESTLIGRADFMIRAEVTRLEQLLKEKKGDKKAEETLNYLKFVLEQAKGELGPMLKSAALQRIDKEHIDNEGEYNTLLAELKPAQEQGLQTLHQKLQESGLTDEEIGRIKPDLSGLLGDPALMEKFFAIDGIDTLLLGKPLTEQTAQALIESYLTDDQKKVLKNLNIPWGSLGKYSGIALLIALVAAGIAAVGAAGLGFVTEQSLAAGLTKQ